MQLIWHGHACFELLNGDKSLVFDPHDGDYIGLARPKARADVALVSHEHKDHNAVGVVAKTDAIVSRTEKAFEASGFSVTSASSWHDECCGSKRGPNLIRRVVAGGVSLVHMGDIGAMPGAEALSLAKDADILMLPVGGTFTVDASSASELVELLSPRVVVPMHYRVAGLKFMLAPVEDFLVKMRGRSILRVGNAVEFSRSDLPDAPSVWVFKR